MVALTYGNAPTAAKAATKTVAATETKAPVKSFFRRFFDALMEARLRQAQRELRLYNRQWPLDSDKIGGI
jgi:hypothetical protein